MRTKIALVIGVLIIVIGLAQGAANARKTTIPGLIFPSPTPTHTLTSTITMSPTRTKTPTASNTPTITLTVTPNPVMLVCATQMKALLEHHYKVRFAIDDMNQHLVAANEGDFAAKKDKLTGLMETYRALYKPGMDDCVPSMADLMANDVAELASVELVVIATHAWDFAMAQTAMRKSAEFWVANPKLFQAVMIDLKYLRQKFPSVVWPIPLSEE